jgi:hypothetical protein
VFATAGAINAGSKGNNMTNEMTDIPALRQLQPGDCIYARGEIRRDGSIAGVAADPVLAAPGTRGMIINIRGICNGRTDSGEIFPPALIIR